MGTELVWDCLPRGTNQLGTHCGGPTVWGPYAWPNMSQPSQVSSNLHKFCIRLLPFHIQNLSNRCRHKYDLSIWRIFFESYFCWFLQFFPTVNIRSVSGCLRLTFKISQIVASTSMIRQFDDFLKILFSVGFCNLAQLCGVVLTQPLRTVQLRSA